MGRKIIPLKHYRFTSNIEATLPHICPYLEAEILSYSVLVQFKRRKIMKDLRDLAFRSIAILLVAGIIGVVILAIPSAHASAGAYPACTVSPANARGVAPFTETFTASCDQPGYQYSWLFFDTKPMVPVFGQQVNHTFNNPAFWTVQLLVTNLSGTNMTYHVYVQVDYPAIVPATATPVPTTTVAPTVTLPASTPAVTTQMPVVPNQDTTTKVITRGNDSPAINISGTNNHVNVYAQQPTAVSTPVPTQTPTPVVTPTATPTPVVLSCPQPIVNNYVQPAVPAPTTQNVSAWWMFPHIVIKMAIAFLDSVDQKIAPTVLVH